VVLLVTVLVAICGGAVAGTIWFSGGRRSVEPVGPAGVKPPARLIKALPYMFTVIALFYLIKLFEAFSSR
jgi:hypothetical protein